MTVEARDGLGPLATGPPIAAWRAFRCAASLPPGRLRPGLSQGYRVMTRRLELEPATDVGAVLDCLLAALYPACRRFAALKRRRSDGWLTYL